MRASRPDFSFLSQPFSFPFFIIGKTVIDQKEEFDTTKKGNAAEQEAMQAAADTRFNTQLQEVVSI